MASAMDQVTGQHLAPSSRFTQAAYSLLVPARCHLRLGSVLPIPLSKLATTALVSPSCQQCIKNWQAAWSSSSLLSGYASFAAHQLQNSFSETSYKFFVLSSTVFKGPPTRRMPTRWVRVVLCLILTLSLPPAVLAASAVACSSGKEGWQRHGRGRSPSNELCACCSGCDGGRSSDHKQCIAIVLACGIG